ncbi:hypothetical protein [Pseudomonas sp. ADPe]|nr:hypothetical protein [Pseudomonas sp. ADPe]
MTNVENALRTGPPKTFQQCTNAGRESSGPTRISDIAEILLNF